MGRVISGICDFVCLCVVSVLKKKNDLSYQHQTWDTYIPYCRTSSCTDPDVKRIKDHKVTKCVASVCMHVDMSA